MISFLCLSVKRAVRVDTLTAYVGRYACSMEMQGMSLSLMKLDDELKRLLDAPADSPFFKQF